MIASFRSVFSDFMAIFPGQHEDDPKYALKDHATTVPPGSYGFQMITCIRNPYTRELSYYLWRQFLATKSTANPDIAAAGHFSFSRFVRYLMTHKAQDRPDMPVGRLQSDYLRDVAPDTTIRFEDLPEAFLGLPCFSPWAPPEFPHIATTKPYSPAEYYTDEAIAAVRKYAARDFALYRYDPDILPWE